MRRIGTGAVLCMALLAAGCGGGGKEKAVVGARPSNPDTYEDAFRIGRSAGADGVVQNETNKFTAGDPIFISFVVRNVPSGSSAKVLWRRLDGDRVMADDEKPLKSNGFVAFSVRDTSGWPPGGYRLFKMVSGAGSGATQAPWRTLGTMDLTISAR